MLKRLPHLNIKYLKECLPRLMAPITEMATDFECMKEKSPSFVQL